jgi:diacylglycerol kinase family enzyme
LYRDSSVKLLLLHNVKAGSGVSVEALIAELERHGHEVVRTVENAHGVGALHEPSAEMVVAAGGDGTVALAAAALAGQGIPLAILPLGTANNIAGSLGIRGSPRELVARWDAARPVPMDLGIATGPWGETWFVEGVGLGLVPGAIARMDGTAEDQPREGPAAELHRAQRTYLEVLSGLRSRPCRYELDDEAFEEELLLLEVLNIRSVGPNLVLAPGASPHDGSFTVVTAGEGHRGELERYLDARVEGLSCRLQLPARTARRLTLAALDELHIDDHVRRLRPHGEVSIRVQPGALPILT